MDADSTDTEMGENLSGSCKQTLALSPIRNMPKTSTPVKGQIVIMSSTDVP